MKFNWQITIHNRKHTKSHERVMIETKCLIQCNCQKEGKRNAVNGVSKLRHCKAKFGCLAYRCKNGISGILEYCKTKIFEDGN